jgi:hypothetical protein
VPESNAYKGKFSHRHLSPSAGALCASHRGPEHPLTNNNKRKKEKSTSRKTARTPSRHPGGLTFPPPPPLPSPTQSTYPFWRHTRTLRPFRLPMSFQHPTVQGNAQTASPTWGQLTTSGQYPGSSLPTPRPSRRHAMVPTVEEDMSSGHAVLVLGLCLRIASRDQSPVCVFS